MNGIELFVGANAGTIQGRRFNLVGSRMFNCAYGPNGKFLPEEVPRIKGRCDSGAFQNDPECRLSFEAVVERQLVWEDRFANKTNCFYRHHSLVAYDVMIDEKWFGGRKRKERWSVAEADAAVRVTIEAAQYLVAQRERLRPRQLVLPAQGVDHVQYTECAHGVLAHAQPGDVFGLGGWCILGLVKSWLPTFWASMRSVLPLVAARGLTEVHIFGVMWQVPLGGLLWLADQHGLTVATDSKKAAMDCTWANPKKAGAKCATWEANVAYFQHALANLRHSSYYREPPSGATHRQSTLWD